MTHIHFEIYLSLAQAISASSKIKTSQLTFPLAIIKKAYTADGYATSVTNLAQNRYETDMVFSEGTSLQMAATIGSVATGYTSMLTVGIAV